MSEPPSSHSSQQPPSGYVPPPLPVDPDVPPASTPAPAPADAGSFQPRRRSRAWIWVLVSVLVVAGVIGACAWTFSVMSGWDTARIPLGNAVAVIPIDGTIAGTGSSLDGIVTPRDFLDLLDQAEEDSSVKAIVLRVDSPGGTVAASEEIATYVAEAKKPIVVSVGDVDASGAYMVSSQADKIVAGPGSAVGSIGVIAEIPNVSGLLDKLGIEFKVITSGTLKDTGSPYRPMTEEEVALIQGQVDESYEQFVDIVARGRKIPRSEVESLATGWAWNGTQAKKLKLVDEIGTYRDALELAARLGGITGDYEEVTYDQPRFEGLFEALMGIETQLEKLNAIGGAGEDTLRRNVVPK